MNKQDNYYIKKVREQFYNTGDLLMRIGIVSNVLDLIERNDGNHYYFTWQEADDTLYSNGDSLLYIEQFLEIFKNRQYHFILKDGSLIRVSFKFSGSLLESQNLLWWPCPIRDFQKLCSNPEQTDLVMDFLDGYIKKQDLLMRSPIRIDVDISNDTVEHPIYHVHLENCDTRIAVDRPLCINGFLRFILHNFYPQEKIDFSDWQFIKFKTSSPANSYIDFLNVGYNIFHN